MRVLFVSDWPVNLAVSSGNTFLNIMPQTIEVESVYTRNGLPDKCVQKAFCINEKMIIKRLFGRSRYSGKIILERYGEDKEVKSIDCVNERIVRLARKKRYTIMFWVQDILWGTNVWKSSELKSFLCDCNPDFIFTLFTNNVIINRLILHIVKTLNKPLILYAWDNNYQWNKYQRSPLRWINHYFERVYMRKVINQAKKFYVISDIQKQDYECIFRKPCSILTKGADFFGDMPVKDADNDILQLVYTGNVSANRWKSLAIIVDALQRLNKKKVVAQLRIYTGTPLTAMMEKALNKEGSSFVMGSVAANDIVEIQKQADILVHVEAFEPKYKFAVRQSFSTKIVDYLHQAKCIFAVGPADVASIDYLIKNDAAIVACDKVQVEQKLRKLFANPQLLIEYGEKAWECGKRNHQIDKIQSKLYHDFEELLYEGSADQCSV